MHKFKIMKKKKESNPEEFLNLAVNFKCKEMTVNLIFGNTSTSLSSKIVNKNCHPSATLVEFYGEDVIPKKSEKGILEY
jgi:hypothetical protein